MMAEDILASFRARRHPLAGRKQSQEHIASRIQSITATKAQWTDEQRRQMAETNSEAQKRRSAYDQTVSRQKRAVSIRRIATKPVTIYGLSDPRTGLIRYVGKTSVSARKRYRDHQRNAEKKLQRHICNWWRSISSLRLKPGLVELEIVNIGGDWVEAEQRWIAKLRIDGNLVNSCDGGQGTDGHQFTVESIEKMRKSHAGQKFTPEQIEARKPGLRAAWERNPERRKQSPEVAKKRILTMAANKAAGRVRKKRPGFQYIIEGTLFNGCHEVARHFNVSVGTVIRYKGSEKAFLAAVTRIRLREQTGAYSTRAEIEAKKLTYNRAYKRAHSKRAQANASQGSLAI